MYSELLKLFEQITQLAPEEVKLIKTSFKPYILKKGDYFSKSR